MPQQISSIKEVKLGFAIVTSIFIFVTIIILAIILSQKFEPNEKKFYTRQKRTNISLAVFICLSITAFSATYLLWKK
jgi:hypothetical protein